MAFYDLPKDERNTLVAQISREVMGDIIHKRNKHLLQYCADEDTYIRKAVYLAIGKAYMADKTLLQPIITSLNDLLAEPDPKVRQTAVNAAGEIGKYNFEAVVHFFDTGLFDEHHSVRNAVIGSMKKMGEKNPIPVIAWSRTYLHHEDKEIRREICHGIELRGRTHPEDILPLLHELQYDKTKRVRWTLVHVIGQISYKKGCLEKVMIDLVTWENKELVTDAIAEIIDVHDRYKDFSYYTQAYVKDYIEQYITSKN
ncbi:MAG: repeat protein [Flavipsychrobacter sp.]|nr:repeat protein [Flavipsychrobacter sp.]